MRTRFEGCCIKHCLEAASIKVYDKFSPVLRIKVTSNDISGFRHPGFLRCLPQTTSEPNEIN
ncbi:MAG TPA: hypothetical protein PLB25_12500, partial [Rhodoferax sp.]|nr:hypothetical protein [Rhodoferax sp.]